MVPENSRRINLACGRDYRKGWFNVDTRDDKERGLTPDKVIDLLKFPWPLKSSRYKHVLVSHYLEHVPHTVTVHGVEFDALTMTMSEIQRILAPGGIVEIKVPDCRDIESYFNTPTHYRIISRELLTAFHRRVKRGPAITFDTVFFFEPVSVWRGPRAAGRRQRSKPGLVNNLRLLGARIGSVTRLRPVPYELVVTMRKSLPNEDTAPTAGGTRGRVKQE